MLRAQIVVIAAVAIAVILVGLTSGIAYACWHFY